jgi:hypothetical protein
MGVFSLQKFSNEILDERWLVLFSRPMIHSRLLSFTRGTLPILLASTLCAAPISAAPRSGRASQQSGPQFEALPLVRSRQNHLLVRAIINGRPAWLGVDTGAPVSAIAAHRREHFGLTGLPGSSKLPARLQINGAFNNVAIARRFQLGALKLLDPDGQLGTSDTPPSGETDNLDNGNTAEGSGTLSNNTDGANNSGLGFNALFSNTVGNFNSAVGFNVLYSNTVGNSNTGTGNNALYSNTEGNGNTAIGDLVLYSNTTGSENTATGANALYNNTTGTGNTATGFNSLVNNTTGIQNTANGHSALGNNTTGSENTAVGFFALVGFNTGDHNTAVGGFSLSNNTTGGQNTAAGHGSLAFNTTGENNSAVGFNTMVSNTSGSYNTATGDGALGSNDTGNFNTADGDVALTNNISGSFNTGLGRLALYQNTSGTGNIAIGESAGFNLTTGDNNIDIGNFGVADESHTIRIGAPDCMCGPGGSVGGQTDTYIAGIFGSGTSGGIGVYVDADGKLGTVSSSERFKKEIKPMDKTSESLLALKPVTFQYKNDSKGIPQFGLIAEEVAKVNPSLVVHDRKGEIYSVRYEAVNAMLLNEFLKEHRTVQELQAARADEQKEIAELKQQLKAQAAAIQKVSERVELNRPSPQVVDNQ